MGPVRVHFIVSPDLTETLVGCGDLISLGILPRGFPEYLGSDNAMHTTEDESEDSSKKEEDKEVEFSHIQHESVRKILTEFSSVFRNRLSQSTRLDTEPMRIELRDDVTIRPLGVSTARLIPARWQDEADEMIRNLLKSHIIEPAGKAGSWCSPSKFVAKPGAPFKADVTPRLRHVVDYTHLNRYVKRPYQAFPTPAEIRKSLPGEVKFMVRLDCLSAYNQLTLDPEHRHLTAFLYHGKRYSDRYQYRCAPMGLSSSSDNWIKAINKILEPCRPWLKQEVDDLLVTASSLDELNTRLREVLGVCAKHGMQLGRDKVECGSELVFAGMMLRAGPNGLEVSPDPARIEALKHYPAPVDIESLRRLLGMSEQFRDFLPDMAASTSLMRGLLRKHIRFYWSPSHQPRGVLERASAK